MSMLIQPRLLDLELELHLDLQKALKEQYL